jgi:hypothetical protein
MMATGILGAVLPFAVGIVGRWPEDACAKPPGLVVVVVDVIHPDENRMAGDARWRRARRLSRLGFRRAEPDDDHSARAVHELGAVIADPKALPEPECGAKPVGGLGHIGVGKFGDDGCRRNGTVGITSVLQS